MYMMRIRQEMFPLILSGKKTSTSRQGLREIKIGQELRFLSADGDFRPKFNIQTDWDRARATKLDKFNPMTIYDAG